MDVLGAVGGTVFFFALSLLLMRFALAKKRDGGLFAALPLGLIPAYVVAGLLFFQLQQRDLPEVKQLREEMLQRTATWSKEHLPKDEQAADREDLQQRAAFFFDILPAIEFCVRLTLLAALAAYLRRRRARLGLALPPEPLSHWTIPYGLVWLVMGPVFWLLLRRSGLTNPEPWTILAAWNLMAVGVVILLFQGLVIFGAKLAAWSRDPRTRAVTPLVLAIAAASLLLLDGKPLLVFLVLTGLFEPWFDLRRLNKKPDDGGAA